MTVTLVVLDSVGVGALPDAEEFGDACAHTLDHTVLATSAHLPNFVRLGLGNIFGVASLPRSSAPLASFGRMMERSPGKDTTTGHWELMGAVLERPLRTFPAEYPSFPEELMAELDARTGRGHLGNVAASGTAIIDRHGAEHLKTGKPIVYTSADSVLQIAAHVDVVPLEQLYEWCSIARELFTGDVQVARVIARPFDGTTGAFKRLGDMRRDFSLPPPYPTVLDAVAEAGLEVIGVGKVPDIYAGRGITSKVAAGSNMDSIDRVLELMRSRPQGLVFSNLVEFDSLYGHRRDVAGYARALAEADARVPELLAATAPGDWLLLASDHGNDPTHVGTDHTREYALLLAYTAAAPGRDLGTRATFADVGATIATLLNVPWSGVGTSFAAEVTSADYES